MARRVRHSRLGFRIAGAVQPPDVIVFGGFAAGSGGATASSGGALVDTTITGCGYRADGGRHKGDILDGYIASQHKTNITGDVAPPDYFSAQDLAARARERQETHVANFRRQFDEQRAVMADVQRKCGVWAAARPERAAAPGDHLCASGQSRMRWVLLRRFR